MLFKKPLSIFLAFFVLLSQFGFAFQVHYCGGSIASVQLNTTASTQNLEEDCCGVLENEPACCNDKIIQFDKKSDTFLPDQSTLFQPIFLAPDLVETNCFKPKQITSSKPVCRAYYWESHAPPLFKLYSHYIFYDKA